MTEEPPRPDPDKLLEQIQADQQAQARGRLKVFLGYAAGVGKTYAMLEATHQRLAEGVDAVVGLVETHGRAETDAMLEGLEVLPRQQIEYHGTHLTEMDIDAILARQPQLAVVDELAHTNAPGSRHPKRYQDVEELLQRGISVYTTLNVQHLESLNDIVQQITGIRVRETIPDDILEQADEIEVVDLPPEELLERLSAGKVYIPDQAARASHLFFRKGNLTALRQIALRRAAGRVDTQMLDYMETKAIPGPWPARERILVAISSHPMSERLVRAGRRLADDLDAEWYVAYVETPDRISYSPVHSEQLSRTMRLAEELGAQVVTISGNTVPEAVLDYARAHNITKIVAGKPLRPGWYERLRGSVLDDIIRGSGPIDVYVISDKEGPIQGAPRGRLRPHGPYIRYLYSALVVALVTLVSMPLRPVFHPVNLVMLFLAGVVVTAFFFGRGPSILASVLSVLAFDFFFVAPKLTFSVYDTEYILTFISLLAVGLVISSLTARVRDQVEAMRKRQERTRILYSLSRDLTTAVGMDAVLETIVRHVGETLGPDVAIFLAQNGKLGLRGASPGFQIEENDYAVATWAFEHGQPAGRGTETLPASSMRFQPLKTTQGTLGILGVKPSDPHSFVNSEQRQLAEALASLAAVAIESALLDEQAREAQVLRESERLQTVLLNSISHDLRTPLATISGSLDSLQEAEQDNGEEVFLDRDARLDLIQTAREETNRLNRLVGNLLDMTRLESGELKLTKEETDIRDLVRTALSHMGEWLSDHPVKLEIPDQVPAVYLDYVLMEQVLINIVDNAAKYSAAGTPIEVSVRPQTAGVEIDVADRGVGIPEGDLERVFDKFYRIERAGQPHGTGLGLSICKGIVEAHGGRIWAENRPGGGTILKLSLPLGTAETPAGARSA
jgi:two-component system sensor histidine kinase KdpD